jgi:hypothetical protein
LRNRIRGVLAEWQARVANERPSDKVLVERVRSEMGHIIRHPHKVRVTADAGWVQLSGYVLLDEKEALINAIRDVPGVFGLEEHLEELDGLDMQLETLGPRTPGSASVTTPGYATDDSAR